jgi:hypothetical protein
MLAWTDGWQRAGDAVLDDPSHITISAPPLERDQSL